MRSARERPATITLTHKNSHTQRTKWPMPSKLVRPLWLMYSSRSPATGASPVPSVVRRLDCRPSCCRLGTASKPLSAPILLRPSHREVRAGTPDKSSISCMAERAESNKAPRTKCKKWARGPQAERKQKESYACQYRSRYSNTTAERKRGAPHRPHASETEKESATQHTLSLLSPSSSSCSAASRNPRTRDTLLRIK